MSSVRDVVSGQEVLVAPTPLLPVDEWQRERLHSTSEIGRVIGRVMDMMAAAGYGERDLLSMRLVLDEAIANAVRHGNGGDLHKRVEVRFQVDTRRVLAEVEDEGPGFDPGQVPDPCASENLEKPSGRGLLLMRYFTTWLRYNPEGNCVALCRYRSPCVQVNGNGHASEHVR